MINKHINSVKLYFFQGLLEFGEIRHFTTTRMGGFSSSPYDSLNLGFCVGDDANTIRKNRNYLASSLDIHPESFTCVNQVHGAHVKFVSKDLKGCGAKDYETALSAADAMVTNVSGVCLMVLHADCVPVLFFEAKKKLIGVVHAGWKGTLLSITQKMVMFLQKEFNCSARHLFIGIGPSIGPCCYEINMDTLYQYDPTFSAEKKSFVFREFYNHKAKLDLWETNSSQLIRAGVPERNIEISGLCTSCHPSLFYSHRRDKGLTGRLGTGIMLK